MKNWKKKKKVFTSSAVRSYEHAFFFSYKINRYPSNFKRWFLIFASFCAVAKVRLYMLSYRSLWPHFDSFIRRLRVPTMGITRHTEVMSIQRLYGEDCRPRWSRVTVLASRPTVHGFKPGWGRWISSERKNTEHKSSGREFKLGYPSLRFQAC